MLLDTILFFSNMLFAYVMIKKYAGTLYEKLQIFFLTLFKKIIKTINNIDSDKNILNNLQNKTFILRHMYRLLSPRATC